MTDQWWNSAVEEQAVDRVHRLGQHKPVTITRFIIKVSNHGTLEVMMAGNNRRKSTGTPKAKTRINSWSTRPKNKNATSAALLG